MRFLFYGLTFFAGMITGVALLIGAAVWFGGASVSVRSSQIEGPLAAFAVGEMASFGTIMSPPAQTEAIFTLEDGTQSSLADYRGKITLVNYWASWCAPCLVEMPELDRLQGQMASEDFEVVIIAIDPIYHTSLRAYERLELEHLRFKHASPTLAYPGQSEDRSSIVLPLTILYDRNGVEIGRLAGEAHWDTDDARALVQAAVEQF